MVNIHFRKGYHLVHVTNEIGRYMFGGIGSYMNELYEKKTEEVGFLHLYNERDVQDIYLENFPGDRDILSMPFHEHEKMKEIDCDIVVVHFYGLAFSMTEEFIRDKKVVYVIHLVPFSEPYSMEDPYAGNTGIQVDFEYMCSTADVLVCVSQAEKDRLIEMYPQWEGKTDVIHNGITVQEIVPKNITETRNRFGYIGRFDYRKGILECIKELKNMDAELYIASDQEDPVYFNLVKEYIEAADMGHKINFLGWCQGKRRKAFFENIDGLIIPSLYEPFGYVVLEAINEGVPIITSRRGGIGEIIGEYKYSYDPYMEGDLYETLSAFRIDASGIVAEQNRYLQEERMQHFTAEKMYDSYVELFQKK